MKARNSFSGRRPALRAQAGGLALLAALWGAAPVGAQEEGSAQPQAAGQARPMEQPVLVGSGMDQRVSLDLRATEVSDAIKYLATKGGLNLSLSKNVAGRVNLFLTDVPIRDIFDVILRSNELAFDRQGEIYSVMTEAEYRALYGRRFTDARKVKTFRLQYAIPQQAFNLLDTLKSEIGRLLVDEDSGTVVVMDTPERLEKMTETLATLEQQGAIRVFDLRYAKAKDVEERLKEQLELNKLGYIKADERSNQVIVKTLPERMKDVERIVAALDRKTREVLINARIVKVTLTDSLDTGIDWNNVFSNLKFHGMDFPESNFRTTTAGTAPSETPGLKRIPFFQTMDIFGEKLTAGQLLFGTIARDGYELFRFLETLGETKVIASPRLLVTENQEARIHVGTREAYVTTTTTTGQTTSTTAEEIEFIDVGIQLVLTPQINEDGYITMKIKPEVSSVIRTLETPSKNKIPIVDTSTAETSVLVKDGSTVVIGGLRKSQKKFSNDEIPFLAKIPLLGELFRQRDKDDEMQELVVFITPHIIEGDELVTGDETAFGGGIHPPRDYQPIVEPTEPPPPDEPSPSAGLPPSPELPEAAPAEPSGPVKLHLHEDLRPYAEGN